MLPAPPHDALLVLADGSVFPARAVAPGTRFGEVVFHTAMSGYQEILTDPATAGQIVVMTQPHLGNYGVSASWAESDRPRAAGVVARQFTPEPANRAAEGGLRGYLRAHRVPAVEGLDIRAVVRRLRGHGEMRGVHQQCCKACTGIFCIRKRPVLPEIPERQVFFYCLFVVDG